jgi:NAD-dependent dihydropyrimidine dehydrogenase PreA subunit
LTIATNDESSENGELESRLLAPRLESHQPIFVSGPLKQTGRAMVKDENLCLHCGLCAERCPTYAWDMRKFVLHLTYAGRPAPESTLRVVETVAAGD